MKIQKIMPAAGAAMLLALAACSGNKKDDSGRIELESYTYDVISEVADTAGVVKENGGLYWRSVGQGVLPVVIGDNKAMSMLRDSLESLARVRFAEKGDAEPRVTPDRRVTTLSPDSVDACSFISNNLAVRLITPHVAVWKNYQEYYICGAAHGNYATTYVNFSLDDHKILSLADIVAKENQPRLLELIKEKLKDNTDLYADAKIGMPENFCITSSGVYFLYGLYDIAPYSSGEIPVSFETYELEDIMTPAAKKLIAGPAAD